MKITRSENMNIYTRRFIKEQLERLDDYIDSAESIGVIEELTPVNAVAASKVLTVSGLPADWDRVIIGGRGYRFRDYIGTAAAASGTMTQSGLPTTTQTVTIGNKVYRWLSVIGAGVKASKVLTMTGLALNTETVTIGLRAYTFVTALTETKATGTLTLSANVTDGNSVTLGTTKYTFRETLAVAFDVKIGASASDTIDNLIAAVNAASGAGTTYGTGTTAHPDVSAAAGAGDTMTITAKIVGTAGNAITTTELSSVCSFGAGTLGSGANPVNNEVKIGASAEACIDNLVSAVNGSEGAGTAYSTGTTANTTILAAKASASTMTAEAILVGYVGNAYVIGKTLTNGSWDSGAILLSGGIDAAVANDVLIGANAEACIDNLVYAIAATAGQAGIKFATGTVAHTQVTAVKASASTMTVTAITIGKAGNEIATTETASNCVFASATLTGGQDAQLPYDVLIGVNAEACIDNLVLAITAGSGAGTNYGTGTTANTNVTAVKTSASTMLCTFVVKGVIGNAISLSKIGSNLSWASNATALSGGVNGTVGVKGQMVFDSGYVYVCTSANTIADANWKKAAIA